MMRGACFLIAFSALGAAQETGDAEADETCALQVQKGSVNCGGQYRPSCQQCPQGNGPSWCNGDCQWDYNSNQCKQKACCRAYNANCLSCAAGVSEEVYCSQNQGKNIPGCPSSPAPTPPPPPQQLCALCETCGGAYPENGGRVTYFRDEKTQWSSYGEWCAGQERTRTPDNSVVFSPQLCCTPAYAPYGGAAMLQVEQEKQETKEVRAHSENQASSNASSSIGGNGWCRLCDECGGGYDYVAGEITQLQYPPAGSDSNSQNYERHEGRCENGGGTRGAPPAAKVCCSKPPGGYTPACAVCQGTCGGSYNTDGGALSYTTNGKSVTFRGYANGCSSSMQSRVSYGGQDAPRLCCR